MDCEKYKKIFYENNGIVKLSDFTGAGYHNTVIDRLIREGKVIKIRAGFYEWQYEDVISEAAIINRLYPDAIICMDSVLYLYDYTERTPSAWHLAVNKNSLKSIILN
ncbi:MAG: type IV toxin-antitoxin system AbiEi family antitoxin domain-containing protein [Acetobacterium sp.]